MGDGVFALDLDRKNGSDGCAVLAQLIAECGELPRSLVSQTPNSGEHHLLRGTGVRNSANKIGPGFDVRGDGGYIIIPPSRLASGAYRWLDAAAPIADAPDWLVQRLTADARLIPAGKRNDELFREAARLRERDVPEADAWQALLELNATRCTPPLDEAELRKLLQSAWKYAPGYEVTDLGNARRIVARHGLDLRFVHNFNKFLIWRGTHWATDRDDEIERWTKDTMRAVYDEARDEPNDDRRKRLTQWALASQNVNRIRAARDLVRSEPGIPIAPERLDAEPMLLGVTNGVIDLRSGRVRDADRDDYITRLAPVAHDPEARAPRWNAFLAQVTGGDQELVTYLKRAVGYSLTGQTVEQCLFLLFGLGANGKSTFLAILRALLGDYAASTDVQTWMARDRSGPNNDLAALRGARVVVSSEVEDGARFAEVLLKLATGGDTLKARFLYSEFFEFRPAFKLWIAANHKPVIRGDDLAIWRRIRLVPFTVTIPPDQQDRNLETSLRDELPGILNWAIEGCLEWQRQGLTTPAAVQAAGNDYRAEMDHFTQFLDECCELDTKRTVRAVVAYDAYTGWCRTQGIEHPRTLPRFWSKLAERGITKSRDAKGIEYRGITLRGVVHDY